MYYISDKEVRTFECRRFRPSVTRCLLFLLALWVVSLFLLLQVHWARPHIPHTPTVSPPHLGSSHIDDKSGGEAASVSTADKDAANIVPPKTGLGAQSLAIAASQGANNRDKLDCFALVVSNEEYVDGALILGYSLVQNSLLAQQKRAELVVIIPEGALSDDSISRLHLAGWTHVFQVEDLAKKAPRAHWAGTYNKLYLFNLTQYSRVAFFDADMLMRSNPDFIFETKLNGDGKHIGALGNSLVDRHGKPRAAYFQTGMMLIIPSADTFSAMMHDFYHSPDARSVNGRDGLIIRRFFDTNYKNLDDALSAHVGSDVDYDWVTGLHFRGGFKPWFNRAKVAAQDMEDVRRQKRKKKEQGKEFVMPPPGKWLEIGPAYELWWETYEQFHSEVLAPRDLAKQSFVADAPVGYDPKRHVWMMRHSPKKTYIQLTADAAQEERDIAAKSVLGINNLGVGMSSENSEKLVKERTEFVVGNEGASCDDACSGAKHLRCNDVVLASSFLQSCDPVVAHLSDFGCKASEEEREENGGMVKQQSDADNKNSKNSKKGRRHHQHRHRHGECTRFIAPTALQPDSASCGINSGINMRFFRPLCNASQPGARRLCLCVKTTTSHKAAAVHVAVVDGSNSNNNQAVHDKKVEEHADDVDNAANDDNHLCRISAATGEPSSACLTRLTDVSHGGGSWSALLLARTANSKASAHDDDIDGRNSINQQVVAILSRHHDNARQIFWFPQAHVPEIVHRALFAHLAARMLHIDWAPATAHVTFPLRKLPKRLGRIKNAAVKRELIAHIVPIKCPEVVAAAASDDNDVDTDRKKSSWIVHAATNWFVQQSNKDHQQRQLFAAVYDRHNSTQLAQASVLHFLLGVPFQSDNTGAAVLEVPSWEELIAQYNSATPSQLEAQLPRCAFLRAAGERVAKGIPLLEQALGVVVQHNTRTVASDNTTALSEKFVTDLAAASVSARFWGFAGDDDKKANNVQRSLAAFKFLRQSTQVAVEMRRRADTLVSLLPRCGLLL